MPVLAIFLTYDTITAMSIFRIVEKCKKQTNKQTNKKLSWSVYSIVLILGAAPVYCYTETYNEEIRKNLKSTSKGEPYWSFFN